MSLPPHQKQGSLFETGHQYRHLFRGNSQAAKFVFFSEKILPMLHQIRGKLATMYCSNNGRPSKEPVLMLGATLLQFMERLPDREATGQCTFDLRWKMALGLEPEQKAFDPTCLVRFRRRLVEHGMEGIGFDAVIQAMQEAGYLEGKTGKQRVDSTYVVGLVSQMGRMELARETLRLALESTQGLPDDQQAARWGEWWERYVENAPDYQLEGKELKSRFKQAGEDAVVLLEWAGVYYEGQGEPEPMATLRRFVEENFDLSGDAPEPTRAQPGGALRNPHDPEAKRRTKSTVPGKEWVGYQNQIAETVSDSACEKGEPTPNVITAVLTQPASESDKHALPAVESQRQSHGVPNPQVEYTDGGYTSGEELARFKSEGRELRGPVARPHDRGEQFNIGKYVKWLP